jgi:hypothetical protein
VGTFTVGQKPARIYNQGLGPGCIANLDLTNTLFFGTDDGLSSASDTVPPLGAIVVDGSSTLYGSTLSTAQIQVQATPGASSWTPSPAQAAAQIALLDIPLQTAAAIATGSVTGQAGGVPLLGAPALIYNFTTVVPANTGGWNIDTSIGGPFIVDMASYLSYDLSAVVSCNAAETSPFIQWAFKWYLDAAGTQLAYQENWCQPATVAGNQLTGNGPIRAQYLQVQASTAGSADSMTISSFMLAGSSRVYSGDAPDLRTGTATTPPGYATMTLGHNIADNIIGGVTGAVGNITAMATTLYVCGLYNGDINVNVLPVGTTSGIAYTPMIYVPAIGLVQVSGGSASVTAPFFTALTQTPRFPFVLQFVSTNAANQSLNFNVLAGSRF